MGEVSKALGGGETVSYSQKDMSAAVLTLLQQYRVVSPIAASPVMIANTATDATIIAATL